MKNWETFEALLWALLGAMMGCSIVCLVESIGAILERFLR